MKTFFKNIVLAFSFLATVAAVVTAIFYVGYWSNSYESRLAEVNNRLDQLLQQLTKSDKQLDSVKEIALTAKVRAEGVKSQTTVLGKELQVDVETPFQQVIARAEEAQKKTKTTTESYSAVSTPPAKVVLNDFLFESKGCERTPPQMVCRVTATNLMDEDRKVKISKRSGTLYDNRDDARKSDTAYFHGQPYEVVVPAKSRSNLVYTFSNVPKKSIATGIAFVLDESGEFNDVLRAWVTN